MPFCQYTKESLQDKGNQQIEGEHCTLTRSELQDIFNVKEHEDCMDIIEVSDEDNVETKKAYLLSKSLLRKSNCAKWREQSGFHPTMLLDKSSPGRLYQGDLVCVRSIRNELSYFIVDKFVRLLCIVLSEERLCFPLWMPSHFIQFCANKMNTMQLVV